MDAEELEQILALPGDNARALGRLRSAAEELLAGSACMRGLLVRMEPRALDDDALRFLLKLAIAESKLGGAELAALPIAIAKLGESPERDFIVRVEAVRALGSVASPGSLQILASALSSDDIEVAERAILPLQLLGERQCVDLLVEVAVSRHAELSEPALFAVAQVMGDHKETYCSAFELEPDEFRSFWRAQRASYEPNVCYRRGAPIVASTLVDLFQDVGQRDRIAEELLLVTGFDCGFDPALAFAAQTEPVLRVQQWAKAAGEKLVPGALHKYGFVRSLEEALRMDVLEAMGVGEG